MTISKATRRFDANGDGRLNAEMQAAWEEDGFLILDGFKDDRECDDLAAHVQTMLADFEPGEIASIFNTCLLYTSPSPRDKRQSRMPSSA